MPIAKPGHTGLHSSACDCPRNPSVKPLKKGTGVCGLREIRILILPPKVIIPEIRGKAIFFTPVVFLVIEALGMNLDQLSI